MELTDEQRERCFLCGKAQDQVEKLILGIHGGICSDCVSVCDDILGISNGTKAELVVELLAPADWEETVSELKERAQAMHEARENALVQCRRLGQLAAKSIRHVHRRQFPEAEALLEEAKEVARVARNILSPFPELNHAYLHDSEKEMVEAAAVLAIVKGDVYPSAKQLGAQVMSYLNGMGEAASEVRRFALDDMRKGNFASAEAILAQMETIYEDLITFDFADSMTGGLRRTCDALRAVVERTRSDLTLTGAQQSLVEELRAARRPNE